MSYKKDEQKYEHIPQEKFAFVQMNEKIHDKELETKPVGFFQDAMIRFAHNKGAVVCAAILLVQILFAIITPFVSDYKVSEHDPHEFSGGQRQRIGIARALSVNPEFLLCDEPISALDVSIQAQVVNVLEDLQQELGLTYLFVAHDLSMVRHISDRIGVMYLGKIVESGESDEVYDNPCHPYTRALLASIPIADPKRALSLEHCGIEGDLPSPLHVPSGCRFHTRCPYATDQCRQQEPELEERTPGHMVACWKK